MSNGKVPAADISLDPPAYSVGLAEKLRAFFAKLAGWREKLRSRPLHEGLAEIFGESKIFAYLAGLESDEQRAANLRMLHQRALKFGTFRKQGLHRFLRFIERMTREGAAGGGGGDFGEAPVLSEASNVVRIMSVHKSKGLEFPVVFLSGLGGKLVLEERGKVRVHRELGIGLSMVDVARNVAYPSAAGERIAEAQRRAACAEELRLLYVGMTRARDCLVLTGHVGKEAAVEKCRQAWRRHEGPLPEDALLKGTTLLQWVMAAIATGRTGEGRRGETRLSVSWNGQGDQKAQVQVILHAPEAVGGTEGKISAAGREVAERILAGEMMPGAEEDGRVAALLSRVTGVYAHAESAKRAAVQTVTFLKSQRPADFDEPEEAPAAGLERAREEAQDRAEQVEKARQRGLATHRVLELLDFTAADSEEAMDGQVARLIEARVLLQEEAEHADWAGIRWFLWESEAGRRLVAAAQRIAADEQGLELRREIAFTYLSPVEGVVDPADWPTVRGVMDVLLVNRKARTAEIFDYKTDSTFLWEERLEDYRRQMGYYLRAASEILGFKVEKATLVFLSPRKEHIVTNL